MRSIIVSKKTLVFFMLLAMLAGAIGGTFGDRLSLAAKGKKVVTGQEFRLVDGKGMVRASLGLNPKGEMSIALHDDKGKPTREYGGHPRYDQGLQEDRCYDA